MRACRDAYMAQGPVRFTIKIETGAGFEFGLVAIEVQDE
jgi:hypothetical protein